MACLRALGFGVISNITPEPLAVGLLGAPMASGPSMLEIDCRRLRFVERGAFGVCGNEKSSYMDGEEGNPTSEACLPRAIYVEKYQSLPVQSRTTLPRTLRVSSGGGLINIWGTSDIAMPSDDGSIHLSTPLPGPSESE